VCARHGAVLVVDDAHGSGTLGTHGRGVLEDLSLEGQVPVVVSTFSKVFGGIGGVILGSTEVVELVQHVARSFVFRRRCRCPSWPRRRRCSRCWRSDGPALVAELHDNAAYMRRELLARGFDLGHSDTHIMPVMVRDERKAMLLHHMLYDRGIYMIPITYPGVKQGEERMRLNVTRGHTRAELEHCLDPRRARRHGRDPLSRADRERRLVDAAHRGLSPRSPRVALRSAQRRNRVAVGVISLS
jgi:7-keto-8-aminopelargonate synthetase-like enzyme